MASPSLERSLLGVTALCAIGSWFYALFWLDDVGRSLEERRGITLGSLFGAGFGLAWLRRFADAVAVETGLTPGAVKRRLLLFPVGIPLLQRALNRRPALPEARVMASRRGAA